MSRSKQYSSHLPQILCVNAAGNGRTCIVRTIGFALHGSAAPGYLPACPPLPTLGTYIASTTVAKSRLRNETRVRFIL
jgi:hypothetical protein